MGVLACTAHMSNRPLAHVVTQARAAGYDGLDINADWFERGPAPHVKPDLSAAGRADLQGDLAGLSMLHSALSANTYLVREDPVLALAAKGHVRKVISLAADCGIPFVHVFTGRHPESMSRPEAFRVLADSLGELCDAGRALGVAVGIEGCVPHFVRSVADHQELFRVLPGADLRVCLDPSHMFLHGESPFEAVERLFDRISLVHVKDASGQYPEFSLPPLGKGDMDWPGLLKLLRGLGYTGDYAIEYEAAGFGWREEEDAILKHGRDFLKANGI